MSLRKKRQRLVRQNKSCPNTYHYGLNSSAEKYITNMYHYGLNSSAEKYITNTYHYGLNSSSEKYKLKMGGGNLLIPHFSFVISVFI